jgi:thiol:disulfide interchange protein DsbD
LIFRCRHPLILLFLLFAAQSASAQAQRITVSATLATSNLQRGQQAVLAVVAQIEPGYHAQSHTPLDPALIPFEVRLDPAMGLALLPPQYPAAIVKNFPALGQLSIYSGKVIVFVPIRVAADAPLTPLTIKGTVSCQICNDQVCFAPQDTPFQISTQIVDASEKISPVDQTLFKDFDPTIFATASTQPQTLTSTAGGSPLATNTPKPVWTVAGIAVGNSAVLVLLVALCIGIIFNLMPCVLPVLPLKAIGFYEAAQHGRSRSIFLGIWFSVGIIVIFGVLALLVVVLRTFQWGEQFSNPIFVSVITIILLIMAAGMFGAFSFRLPTAVYNITPRHDTISGNIAFGALSAVLSTPCTAPLFPGLLAWAVGQPAWLGVIAMLTVGFGMALPYLVLSAFPNLSRHIPRTGPWSLLLKEMLGFLLLAFAFFFAGGSLFGTRISIWGFTLVIYVAALFLIIRTIFLARRPGPIVSAAVAAVLLAGTTTVVAARLTLTPAGSEVIPWQPYSETAFASARDSGQVTMVEFTASWCFNCIALEATTFHDPRSGQAVRNARAIALRADLTDRHAPGWKLLGELNPAGGIPLTAIYAPGSDDPQQLASLYTTQDLVDALARAKSPSLK